MVFRRRIAKENRDDDKRIIQEARLSDALSEANPLFLGALCKKNDIRTAANFFRYTR